MSFEEESHLTNEVAHGDLASLPARLTQQLVRGADPNYQDANGRTALYHLLYLTRREGLLKNDANIVQAMHILLEGGASVDVQDNTGQTIVHFAAAENMPSQILIPLLMKCDTNQLSAAAVYDLLSTDCLDVDLLIALCQSNVDLMSSVGEANVTAIHRMIEKRRPTDALLVHTLANERSREFGTIKDDLLLHACIHGSKETLEALVQLDASVAGNNMVSGLPALLLAASSANDEEAVEKVNILVANGANMHITSSNGQNLCHIAAIQRHSRLLELAIAARVDHTHRDEEGSTPLHYACAAPGNGAVISLLIDAGLDVNEQNSDGFTPLSLSISSKHVNNILPLIRAVVDINQCDLKDCMFQDLQILAQPEIISASPRPLEYTLVLSYFYELIAQEQQRLKESYMRLSVELEDTAIDMIEGLHSSQLQGLALHGDIVEMAISTCRKRFIATDALQYELLRVWQEWQDPSYIAYCKSCVKFLLQTIARPFIILIVWPLIVFNIPVSGTYLSWDIMRPVAAPTVRYQVEAIAYFGFITLLFVEAIELEFSKPNITVLEWITLMYVLALLYNEFSTFIREGFHYYFTRMGHKRNCLTIILFIVFYIMRFVVVVCDTVESRTTILRVSSYILAGASTLSWTRILRYLRVHPLIGPIHKSYNAVMKILTYFVVILYIYLLAFASGMVNIYSATTFAMNVTNTSNCPANAFDSVQSSAESLFWSLFGLLDLDKLENCSSFEEIVGKIVFAIWQLQALVLLLNMLIALVTTKFDEFQRNADIEWKFSLAATIRDVQKCQRFPIPFNLLYIFVDLLEWTFNKDDFMKRRFDLLPATASVHHHTGTRDMCALEIGIFRQAEETKALGQAATRGDVVEINERLVKMEASLLSVCGSLNIQSKYESSVSALDTLKRDSWGSYRKRLRKMSGSNEYIEDTPKKERKRKGRFKKSLMHRMLEKSDSNVSAKSPVSSQPPQLNPITESESTTTTAKIPNSDALTHALISLQQSVQRQGYTLLQIQSQLANVDNRLKHLEGKHSKPAGKLMFRFEEEGAV